MATANANAGRRAASSSAQDGAASAVQVDTPSRREFLYYIWTASIAMMLGQYTVVGLFFAFPRFREGEFGGEFPFDPAALPKAGSPPQSIPEGRFWVSNTDKGLLALYAVCTHLGCLPKWVPTNFRFECPCHGSKYENDGTWIEGPAPRGLDRFPVIITFDDGETVVADTGTPYPLDPDRTIIDIKVDTGSRVNGAPQGQRLE